jgi:hypothetical protein
MISLDFFCRVRHTKSMERNYDLRELLKAHENKWVALSLDHSEVLGAGDNLQEAKKEAEQKGGEKFTFLKLPPFDIK